MRLSYFLSLILFSISSLTFAQRGYSYLGSKEVGEVILLNKDTLRGNIILKKLPAYVEIKNKGEKTIKIYVGEIAKVTKSGKTFLPIDYLKGPAIGGSKRSLVEVIDSGYIKLYRYFSFGDGRNSTGVSKQNSFNTEVIIYKPGIKIASLDEFKFSPFLKGIKEYVRDYPALVDKLGEDGYKSKRDIENIVREYNVWKAEEIKVQATKQKEEQQQKEEAEKEALRQELEKELREELKEELRREMMMQDSLKN